MRMGGVAPFHHSQGTRREFYRFGQAPGMAVIGPVNQRTPVAGRDQDFRQEAGKVYITADLSFPMESPALKGKVKIVCVYDIAGK